MTATLVPFTPRLVEAPLGDDALERPTAEAVAALWRATLRTAPATYHGVKLRRLVQR